MSTHKEYDYPLAPLTVKPAHGRNLDFAVDRNGTIEIVAEIDDYSYGHGPTEVSFWLTQEDWAAVVAHIAADSAVAEDA